MIVIKVKGQRTMIKVILERKINPDRKIKLKMAVCLSQSWAQNPELDSSTHIL